MAQQASFVQEGVDRFNEAFHSLEDELQRIQKRVQSRRRSIERQLSSGRKNLEKRTRKQLSQLRSDLRRNPVARRARSWAEEAARQAENGLDSILGVFQIASKSDVQRIDRRLSQLNRKLKELERVKKANGDAAQL